jgi:hypothetical protein
MLRKRVLRKRVLRKRVLRKRATKDLVLCGDSHDFAYVSEGREGETL